MTLTIAIVAHEARREMAERLAEKVDAALVVWDDGQGPRETHERAWIDLLSMIAADHRDKRWGMVIEDDAIPVSDFKATMAAACAVAPFPVVSAYLGRGRPVLWQHQIAQVMAVQCDWLIAPDVFHGVGIGIRADHIDSMIGFVTASRPIKARYTEPLDEAMGRWVRHKDIGVAYSHPSLLNHNPDLPSIIGEDREPTHTVEVPAVLGAHHDTNYRKAWHFATQTSWGPSYVMIPPPEKPLL